MQRTIVQWTNCDPRAMVTQSPAAIQYAFEDAKADILQLYKELQRFKNVARVIAYPSSEFERSLGTMDLQKILQATYSAEQMWVEPEDR